MTKPRVHLTKRRNPSGKLSYTARWYCPRTGSYRSRAWGSDLAHAGQFVRRKREEIRDGIDESTIPATWDEFSAEHVASKSGRRNAVTIEKTLREFGEVCQPKSPARVTFTMVERYVQHLRKAKAAPRTINRKLAELRHALNKGVQRHYVRKSPMVGFSFEAVEETIPVVLSEGSELRIMDACLEVRFRDPLRGELWKTFLYVLATTGCRRGEILDLPWDRINLEEGFITLVGTKTHQQRFQPLVGGAVTMLRAIWANAPKMVRDGTEAPKEPSPFRPLKFNINRVFDRIAERAGVPHARIKDLRSTAGTATANGGFDVSQTGDLLGHSDYRTTRRHYVRRELENKRLMAEALAARLQRA